MGDEFPYSNKQVNRAGDRIRRARARGEVAADADLALLKEYRALHFPVLRQVQERLSRLLHKKLGLPEGAFPVTARPLKTEAAIIDKLVREKTRLSTMQDIAGTRAVVPALDFQERVLAEVVGQFKNCHLEYRRTREKGPTSPATAPFTWWS